ncbi:AEC family transporter [Helicobacter sp. MIT 05-5293]|uniref:AEC family transporter n=1 Tax=Helicobacter sp. MIT 05-5293 TaxID=1548149 RepID=UPI00051E0E19|nr:AEC family transporter [Helicobacter sp. MIT 05-5293]TLD80100.1 AEC family transporter [Helicobacter sp. MIT 05-5293]
MLLAIYSVCVFVCIGYIAKLLRLVGNRESGILLGFLLNFALPAQIFNGTYHAHIDIMFLQVCLIGFLCSIGGGLALFGIGKILKVSRDSLITMSFMGAFGNTLFLGLPIVNGALGEAYANKVIIYDQIVTGIPIAFLAPLILSMGGKGGFRPRAVALRLFQSPLFLALLMGLLLKAFPISIPDELFLPLKSLAQTATPVALFAIGVQMSLKGIKEEWRLTMVCLLGKMLVAPLLLFLFVILMIGEFDDLLRMALIEVAMPPVVSAGAIVIKAGLNAKLAVSAIAFGILLSFISVPIWLYFT